MEKETFEKELAMCRQLSQENGGKCYWGECDKCGVIPLLYKLGKGEIYEDKAAIEKIKQDILQNF